MPASPERGRTSRMNLQDRTQSGAASNSPGHHQELGRFRGPIEIKFSWLDEGYIGLRVTKLRNFFQPTLLKNWVHVKTEALAYHQHHGDLSAMTPNNQCSLIMQNLDARP